MIYNLPMDLKQLRALLAIAETGSVTRAADILHIVQPAISRQLKLLEEELGVALFERERHGMVLTPPGRLFVERASRALQELDAAKEEISPRAQQVSGTVVVGFLASAADLLVSSFMSRVRQNYPHIQLRSYITYVSDLALSLERGDVDLALLYLRDGSTAAFATEPLLKESLYLVGSADAALDLDTPLPLGSLQELPLILPAIPHGVRELLQRECAAAGVVLNVVAETDAVNAQKALVMGGTGLAILSGSVVFEEVKRGLLTACPIAATNLKRTLYLARPGAKPLTTAASRVLDELRRTVLLCVTDGRWPGAVLLANA